MLKPLFITYFFVDQIFVILILFCKISKISSLQKITRYTVFESTGLSSIMRKFSHTASKSFRLGGKFYQQLTNSKRD